MMQFRSGIDREKIIEFESGARAQLRKTGQISNRRIEPNIEILAGRVGNLKAEVRCIARDVPVLESLREPFIELANHAFLHRAASDPGVQKLLEVAESEEKVLGLAPNGG